MEIQYLCLEARYKENREVQRGIDEIPSSRQSVMGAAVKELERNLLFEIPLLTVLFYIFCRLEVFF